VSVDEAGNIYAAGQTSSSDWPVTAALQPTLQGQTNAFAIKVCCGPDAGTSGVATQDAGEDGGGVDGGQSDAGQSDAGDDAGQRDAGAPDAGAIDTGSHDGGAVDAGGDGVLGDAGVQRSPRYVVGCGCRPAGEGCPLLGLVFLVLSGPNLRTRRTSTRS
jgi:hypothetical protein